MKHIKKTLILIATGMFILTSCFSDLDRFPINDVTGEAVYRDVLGFKMALAKVYGAMILTGNAGGSGAPDITGIDEGSAGFNRTLFSVQTLPTDEALFNWADAGIADLNNMTFTALNPISGALYNRVMLNILYANHFMRQSADNVLAERGFSEADRAEIAVMRAEARFIRAFLYWVLLDVFGNPPFIDETMTVGGLPMQKSLDFQTGRQALFDWLEGELLYLADNGLREAGTSPLGRVCRASAWALLARFYLNANVYTSPVGSPGSNTAFYTRAIEFAGRVINSGLFQLHDNYEHLFLNDNRQSPEIIWGLIFDGANTRAYAGPTFLVNAPSQGAQQVTYRADLLHFGLHTNANWAGGRVRGDFIDLFDRDNDRRFLFVGPTDFIGTARTTFAASGKATFKFRNIPSRMVVEGCQRTEVVDTIIFDTIRNALQVITRIDTTVVYRFEGCTVCSSVEGAKTGCHLVQHHLDNEIPFGRCTDRRFADNTVPLFRLAEMYLIYAEASLRGGSGATNPTAGINRLQARAGLPNVGGIDIYWILDERARELYWEMHRRTDLVRFNRFTDGPGWEWRGNVQEGAMRPAHFNVFPLPATDINANPNLRQNPGF